jgi:uncharacterized protein (TIGR03435 family)
MKRELLASAGTAAVAMLIAATQARATYAQGAPKFETASVKPVTGCGEGAGVPRLGISASPARLSIKCQTVDFLIRQAYVANGRDPLFVSSKLYGQQIKGGPAWISSERYTIDAKAEHPQSRETMLGPMLQALLEDRFKLKIHRETREVAVYQLTAGKGGPKLQAAEERGCAPFDAEKLDPPQGTHLCGVLLRSLNPAVPTALYGATMVDLCRGLSQLLDREVVDKTGISGVFDIRLELSRADLFPLARRVSSDPDAPASASEPSGSSIFRALQTLGLKLESGRGPGEFFVIDHVERPSAN